MRNEIFLSLLLGFLLDCLVGDPHSIPHPVVLIGKLISALEKGLRKLFPKTRAGEMTAGGILWVLTVAVSFCVPLGLLYLCGLVSPWLRLAPRRTASGVGEGSASETMTYGMCWRWWRNTGFLPD